MLKELDTEDWQAAFYYANPDPAVPLSGIDCSPFDREDVRLIRHLEEGANAGPNWIVAGRLKDKRWFFLSAGADRNGETLRSRLPGKNWFNLVWGKMTGQDSGLN
jgi:hypothetical protein